MLPTTSDVPGLQPLAGSVPGLLAGVRSQYHYPPRGAGPSLEWASRQQSSSSASSSSAPARQTPTAAGSAPRSSNAFPSSPGKCIRILTRAIGGGSIGLGAGGAVSIMRPPMRDLRALGCGAGRPRLPGRLAARAGNPKCPCTTPSGGSARGAGSGGSRPELRACMRAHVSCPPARPRSLPCSSAVPLTPSG